MIMALESRWQSGDLIVRRKKSDNGFHYGRLVRASEVLGALAGFYPEFLVSHTTPDKGDCYDTIEDFAEGLDWWVLPQNLNPIQQTLVEGRAIQDHGRPYDVLQANCEDKAPGFSPTRNDVFFALGIVGAAIFISKIAERSR